MARYNLTPDDVRELDALSDDQRAKVADLARRTARDLKANGMAAGTGVAFWEAIQLYLEADVD